MKTIRKDVYRALDSEREYQDDRWDDNRGGALNRTLGDFVLYMQHYLNDAVRQDEPVDALDSVRKVGALAVACMEAHGAQMREGYGDDEPVIAADIFSNILGEADDLVLLSTMDTPDALSCFSRGDQLLINIVKDHPEFEATTLAAGVYGDDPGVAYVQFAYRFNSAEPFETCAFRRHITVPESEGHEEDVDLFARTVRLINGFLDTLDQIRERNLTGGSLAMRVAFHHSVLLSLFALSNPAFNEYGHLREICAKRVNEFIGGRNVKVTWAPSGEIDFCIEGVSKICLHLSDSSEEDTIAFHKHIGEGLRQMRTIINEENGNG